MNPYFQNEKVTLYLGDCRHVLPKIHRIDAIVTDPPYSQTSLDWDVWPTDWPDIASHCSNQMWCFGSLKSYFRFGPQFSRWTFAQDLIWEKHNGSNCANDRFRRVHEQVVHWYQGQWSDVYKNPVYVNEAVAKTIRRKKGVQHWGNIGKSHYVSEDGGPKLMGSVMYSRSCHGYAVNETQKPESIIAPLLQYSVPPGGMVLDCFAGSGTVLAVAIKLGRYAIGIEKRESQCAEIVRRLSQQDLFLT